MILFFFETKYEYAMYNRYIINKNIITKLNILTILQYIDVSVDEQTIAVPTPNPTPAIIYYTFI